MVTKKDKTQLAHFGVIGLAVMGSNLALNVSDQGYSVAVWNLETEAMERFIKENPDRNFVGAKSLEEFVRSLERPRRILMMIKAGDPVDQTIEKLKPLLDREDIVIDGGNSWFKDTRRREDYLKRVGVNFFGMGVSGGEEGARHGPSIMPGGSKQAYEHVRPILEAIAAKTDSGPCVTYVGPDGAGHFVKMVHNGIEYGDMQLIAETYDSLRRAVGLELPELADVFADWNRGPLESFLIELTSQILTVMDEETGRPLVDMVMDRAGQKGTGKWTAQVALDLGIPIPTTAAAIDARFLSSMKDERVAASHELKGPTTKLDANEKERWIKSAHDALYAAKICSYAQGMSLIQAGSAEYKWGIDSREIARIWKGGCIIRARLLDLIMQSYERRPDLKNLLLDGEFNKRIDAAQAGWRDMVGMAQRAGIPVPALSASLAYFDSYRTARLPQNLTQAQRDAFGSHTYERIDHPEKGFIHTDWLKLASGERTGVPGHDTTRRS
jgi:6-phosphogluconate dehydrogenase